MIGFLVKILVNAAAVWAATALVGGIDLSGHDNGSKAGTLILVALIFGVVNALIKPLMRLLSLPVIWLSLGLFALVINALMLWLTSWVAGKLDLDFTVDGFWPALLGAIIISAASWLLNVVIPDKAKD